MKKKITVISAVLMLLSIFAGCTNSDDPDAAIAGKCNYDYYQRDGQERTAAEKNSQQDIMIFEFFEDHTVKVMYGESAAACQRERKESEIIAAFADGTAEVLVHENEELYIIMPGVKFILIKQ